MPKGDPGAYVEHGVKSSGLKKKRRKKKLTPQEQVEKFLKKDRGEE